MRSPHLAQIAIGLSVGLLAASLGAPSIHATKRAATPVTLTFQAWDPPSVTNEFLVPCEKKYPNIHVKTVTVAGDYATKMQTEFASGTAPDFFYGQEDSVLQWAAAGQLLDQLPYLNALGFHPASAILPQDQYWANGKVGGKFLGQVDATEDIYLFYNKNNFAQAGMTSPPSDVAHAWTWSQFVAVARKLTVDRHGKHPGQAGFDPKHIVRYGVSIDPTYWPTIVPLIFSNGGRVFDKTYTHFTLNQPAAADAVQAVVDLATKDHVMPTPTQITAAGGSTGGLSLASGRVAMEISGNWDVYFQQYPKRTYPMGIGVLPKFKVYRTVVTGTPMVAYVKTAHPKETVQMIECVHENSTPLWRSGIWMPTSKKDLFGPDYTTWASTSVHPANFRSVAIDSLKYAQDAPPIHMTNFGQVWTNLITPAMEQVLSGKQSARAVFTALKPRVDAVLAQR